MLEQPEPFNFYNFSPLFILAFIITHTKQEIGYWILDLEWSYQIPRLERFARFMMSNSDLSHFTVFFITLFGSLFFMLWRFGVHCDKCRAWEAQEENRSS